MPYNLQKMVGIPPENVCKAGVFSPMTTPTRGNRTSTPTRSAPGSKATKIVVNGNGSPTKPSYGGRDQGGYQGWSGGVGGDRPKGAGPPVLPAPRMMEEIKF